MATLYPRAWRRSARSRPMPFCGYCQCMNTEVYLLVTDSSPSDDDNLAGRRRSGRHVYAASVLLEGPDRSCPTAAVLHFGFHKLLPRIYNACGQIVDLISKELGTSPQEFWYVFTCWLHCPTPCAISACIMHCRMQQLWQIRSLDKLIQAQWRAGFSSGPCRIFPLFTHGAPYLPWTSGGSSTNSILSYHGLVSPALCWLQLGQNRSRRQGIYGGDYM